MRTWSGQKTQKLGTLRFALRAAFGVMMTIGALPPALAEEDIAAEAAEMAQRQKDALKQAQKAIQELQRNQMAAPAGNAAAPNVRAPKMNAAPNYESMATEEAVKNTQDLLRDKNAREKAIRDDAKAVEADRKVKELAGSEANTQRMYDISADLMQSLTVQTNGDAKKMLELIEQAKGDPAAFLQSLSPEQKAAIRGLAQDIEKAQGKVPPGR